MEEVITYPHPNVMLKNGVPAVMHFDQLGSVKAVTDHEGKKDEQVFYRSAAFRDWPRNVTRKWPENASRGRAFSGHFIPKR